MSHAHVLAAFGVSFRLGAADRGVLAAAVGRARELGWTDSTAGETTIDYLFRTPQTDDQPRRFELECHGVPISCAADLDDLLDAFSDHAKLQTACRAKDVLFVHAGVIGWQGRGIVMPGRSGAGKTTLVAALIEAGAEYYSDEFAVLDAEGHAHAYAIPLSIRTRGARRERRSAEQIGGRVGTTPISVDLVVITEYQRGARWKPRRLSSGEALLGLMEHTVAARQAPEHAMSLLRRTVLAARAIGSRRGDARAIAGRLLDELAR